MCGALGALVTVPTAAVTDILSPLDGLLRLDNNVEFRRIQCANKDLTLIVWVSSNYSRIAPLRHEEMIED